jgi:DNA processing protein
MLLTPPERVKHAIELSLAPGIGKLTQKKLWNDYKDSSELFSLTRSRLEQHGLADESAGAITSRRFRAMADEIYDWALERGIAFLLSSEEGYPALLHELHDPPLLLYAHGNPKVLEIPGIAIVGTRRPTCYGLQMAQGLAADLAMRGLAIISGLARGIDAVAHRGCLEAQGKTVAVLGCGIDVVYPREHRQLTQRIIETGLLLSEFAPGTSPSPQNFPVRNRIISGLALGTMIVEASEYSGSLITARLAIEQNREVFALPGNITAPQSFGPNFLIKQGAKLVQSWRDVVEELPPELRLQILAREQAAASPQQELALLSADEERILNVLETDRAQQFDRIYRLCGLEISRVSDLLLSLEMRGFIRQAPGNLYFKVARPPK